jgi:hypothetical protein
MRASDKEVAPQVLEHPGARTTRRHLMATEKSSVPHAHPSTDDHDDTVEAHYASLERIRPHACSEGLVFLTYTVFDEAVGDEVERIEAVPCRRCADSLR